MGYMIKVRLRLLSWYIRQAVSRDAEAAETNARIMRSSMSEISRVKTALAAAAAAAREVSNGEQ
jgi:hypothetical protein